VDSSHDGPQADGGLVRLPNAPGVPSEDWADATPAIERLAAIATAKISDFLVMAPPFNARLKTMVKIYIKYRVIKPLSPRINFRRSFRSNGHRINALLSIRRPPAEADMAGGVGRPSSA
jgi:hypothetical protein